MPVYDFRCLKCKKKVTLTMPLAEYEGKKFKCPKCGGKRLERLVATFQAVTSRKS
ncbi:MAG TPA: zinc ribbon domain-containing protein [Nitrospinae bacterium]|nr:zinc ribbon domain-containing protein [Nitrospinota bacterium]